MKLLFEKNLFLKFYRGDIITKNYEFDALDVKDQCVKWIQDFFEENGKGCNAVVGISGGKDSAVVAALCVEALGKDRVIGVLMPNDVQSDIDFAKLLVNHLGIKHHIINVKDAVNGVLDQLLLSGIEISEQTKINLPPRIRMSVLYAVTRYGDGAGDFSPLSNLTVTEVKEIGRSLNLPDELVDKVPIDGLSDQSDEEKLGFTYDVLDKYIRTGEISDKKIKERIDYLHELNKFKLELMPSFEYE